MSTTPTTSASLYVAQIRFCRALAVVRSLPTESRGAFQPSVQDRLTFYGFYKQALVGDCMLLKPSSKHIVQYAKWKAWDRLRGVSPIDAQVMYINALVDLLKQFLQRFPNSELNESLKESINYLEETENTATVGDSLVQWDTNDQEKEEYYLGHIEQEQILSEQQHYTSPITVEFPITPELSPKHSLSRYLYNNGNSQQQHYVYDNEVEELDHEVATATSSLYLSTPNQHPYHQPSIEPIRKLKRKRRSSNLVLQTLQTEVAALCEEIDHLRTRDMKKSNQSLLRWSSLWLLKSIAKQAFFNFLILMLLFLVLWRRKSPIAYAVISFAGPQLGDFMHYIFSHVVFWKVTV